MYQAKEKIAENGWNPTILSIEDSIIQDLQFNPHNLFSLEEMRKVAYFYGKMKSN
ncbi:MAG: hypothetical protein AB4372_38595 [Xenococcus sp. (in: cyanobacteria)]